MGPVEPARQADLRNRNLALLLARVAGTGPAGAAPSRAALAAATGMSRATVSALVDALLAGGLLQELPPPPPTGAGRPAHGLRLSGERVAALGVEVGADHLVACVRDLTGAVRARAAVPEVDRRGRRRPPAQVLAASADLAAPVLAQARAAGLDVVGGAWALPGLVDAAAGRLRLAPNLGWRDVDVLDLLGGHPALAGLSLEVDNEASLAALAELWHPGGVDPGHVGSAAASFVLVTGEVGIGAGLVLGGRPVRGERGWSGELGHVTVDPDGPVCGCGARGCLESYAGLRSLLRRAGLERAGDGGCVAGEPEESAAAAALGAAARAGDRAALAALEQAGRALGVALAGAVNLLDVDAVVLGGSCAPLAPWLVGPLEAELARRVLRARLLGVPVRVSATGARAASMGAAALVLQHVLDEPAPFLQR